MAVVVWVYDYILIYSVYLFDFVPVPCYLVTMAF